MYLGIVCCAFLLVTVHLHACFVLAPYVSQLLLLVAVWLPPISFGPQNLDTKKYTKKFTFVGENEIWEDI